MNLTIQSKSSEPIYEQIKNQLKENIISGKLKQGEALPSIRNLARDLKISVITTKRAYEELEKEGLIYSVAGKGFYVDNPDMAYLTEKKVQGVEQQLEAVLALCRQADLSKEDVKDMIDILWEEG
jgi:GntR family transcriptional regulator